MARSCPGCLGGEHGHCKQPALGYRWGSQGPLESFVSLVDFDWWFPHVSNMVKLYVLFSNLSTIFEIMTRCGFQVEIITIFPRGHSSGVPMAPMAPMWMFKFIDPLKQSKTMVGSR